MVITSPSNWNNPYAQQQAQTQQAGTTASSSPQQWGGWDQLFGQSSPYGSYGGYSPWGGGMGYGISRWGGYVWRHGRLRRRHGFFAVGRQ